MENNETKKSWLDRSDEKFDQKNKGLKTLWQLLKFSVVSILSSVIQVVLVNVLYFCLKSWQSPLPSFLSAIFSENTVGAGNDNWGYVLPFFVSNAASNIFGYFLNKKKTFKSDAPWWHFVIYIGLLVVLILFCTWLQGVVANAINETNIDWLLKLSPTLASAVAGTLQFIILFPVQKFVLLREKKQDTASSNNENNAENDGRQL